MEEIVKCGEGIRTIAFPKSVQRTGEDACNYNRSLTSVVINNWLRELNGNYVDDYHKGIHADAYRTTFIYSPFCETAV